MYEPGVCIADGAGRAAEDGERILASSLQLTRGAISKGL